MKILSKCRFIGTFIFIWTIGAWAEPAVMGGINYNFGGDVGVTVKIISDNKDKKINFGAGVSYYPWSKSKQKFGLDAGVGYTQKKVTVMGGWDFLQNKANASVGYSHAISSGSDEFERKDCSAQQ